MRFETTCDISLAKTRAELGPSALYELRPADFVRAANG